MVLTPCKIPLRLTHQPCSALRLLAMFLFGFVYIACIPSTAQISYQCPSDSSQSATACTPSPSPIPIPTTYVCPGSGFQALSTPIPSDGRFSPGAIGMPTDGYTDSIFVNATGDRIYFTHSSATATDFEGLTSGMPYGQVLPGQTVSPKLDYNSDLYYVAWNGSAWSLPINLGSAVDGSQINSLGNECCVWLNDDETEIIFYRGTSGIVEYNTSGNLRATRANRDAPWSRPVPLPGKYGVENQADRTLYRHDIHKTTSGDLYLNEINVLGKTSTLLYGRKNGDTWLPPVIVPGMENMGVQHNSQVWISRDELTMLFNTRGDDTKTALSKMTRPDRCSAWSGLTTLPIDGFADAKGGLAWGEPTFAQSENYMLFIRFETSLPGWPVQMMFAPGTSTTGFTATATLN